MEKERLDWVLSGISLSKCNKLEKGFVKKISEKQPEDLTAFEERRLEEIYRGKSR